MKELIVDATIENLDRVIQFVDDDLEAADCSMKIMLTINLSVEEIFVNIAHYAYTPNIGKAVIRMEISDNPSMLSLTFLDQGIPYNPLEKEDPDVTLSAEERQIGGLGIFLVKKSMDDVQYEYKDGQNIFTIKKYF